MKNEYYFVHNEHKDWVLVHDGSGYRYSPHGFPLTFETYDDAKRFINRFEYLKSRGYIKSLYDGN